MKIENKILLLLLFKIFIYWVLTVLTAAVIVSIFSAFLPWDKYRNFIQFYSFNYHNLVYLRLTIMFFIFIGGFMAIPGFLINLAIYFVSKRPDNYKIKKIISLAINFLIASTVLYFYYRFNISRTIDLLRVIAPVYFLSILIWGWIILPGKAPARNLLSNTYSKAI